MLLLGHPQLPSLCRQLSWKLAGIVFFGAKHKIWLLLFPLEPVIPLHQEGPGTEGGISSSVSSLLALESMHSGQLHTFSNLPINVCGLHYDLLDLALALHLFPSMAWEGEYMFYLFV